MLTFHFDHSYARDLPQLVKPWPPSPVPAPRLLFLNTALAKELNLDVAALQSDAAAALFSGNALPPDAQPVAQAYAGHQFGGFSPQLGDGRALLLGEVIDRNGQRRDVAFKGSGRTPFSRGGDGKAAIGPMLREVLISEAMHALGIPTTRALAVVTTGEPVLREQVLPGAVLTRVAASHIRVGTFQYCAVRGDLDNLRLLAQHTLARHDPALRDVPQPLMAMLRAVVERQAALIAQWMNVGFIHGVMNTDNMLLSGETIDYGPCAFMEAYDPAAVFSSIDRHGRYAYGNQPAIARWNLARLAEALLPLLEEESTQTAEEVLAQATQVVESFADHYQRHWLAGQRAKLGLRNEEADDVALATDWLQLLHAEQIDFTLAWRYLADAAAGNEASLRVLCANIEPLETWLARWRERCNREEKAQKKTADQQRAQRMHRVNPWVISRNHRVEQALLAASKDGDLNPFERLLSAVRHPYEASAGQDFYAEPAPMAVTATYRTFCGT